MITLVRKYYFEHLSKILSYLSYFTILVKRKFIETVNIYFDYICQETLLCTIKLIDFSKMKRSFFQVAVVSILLYGCTTWMLTERLEKLDGNYTRILRAILNKSWWQHPIRHQLYGHLPPITKTIQVRWTRHAGHCWRSRDEFISDILLWTPTYGWAKAGQPAMWGYGM